MSAKDSQHLKNLHSRKGQKEADIEALKKEAGIISDSLFKAKGQLKAIAQEIEGLKKKNPIVTEHAVIRYMERAMGLDLEEVKSQILNDRVRQQIDVLGNGKFPIGNGFRVVVKDMSIVSIL